MHRHDTAPRTTDRQGSASAAAAKRRLGHPPPGYRFHDEKPCGNTGGMNTRTTPERDGLDVGIIGCGYGAENLHLPVLASLPGLRVVALADVDAERLRRVGDRFSVHRRYHDYETLLRDAEVDAVAVCAPPAAHTDITLAVLDAGQHVLVEKPRRLGL